jgi:hypothetical protein
VVFDENKGYVSLSVVVVSAGWSDVTAERFMRPCARIGTLFTETAEFCLCFIVQNKFSCIVPIIAEKCMGYIGM